MGKRKLPALQDWKRVAAAAVDHGAVSTARNSVSWDIAGRCERPVRVEVWTRKGPRRVLAVGNTVEAPPWGKPMFVEQLRGEMRYNLDLDVRCRKCPACQRWSAAQWANRAYSEIRASNRTWFGTLTLSPEAQQTYLARARMRMHQTAVDYDALEPGDRFGLVEREIAHEVSTMWRRLRKAGHKFRYIQVAEAHKSGDPHFHVLVHEIGSPITKRTLQAQWRLGWSMWKLTDDDRKAGWYVCKYISKTLAVRVRASVRYGKMSSSDIDGENEPNGNGVRETNGGTGVPHREKIVTHNPTQEGGKPILTDLKGSGR